MEYQICYENWKNTFSVPCCVTDEYLCGCAAVQLKVLLFTSKAFVSPNDSRRYVKVPFSASSRYPGCTELLGIRRNFEKDPGSSAIPSSSAAEQMIEQPSSLSSEMKKTANSAGVETIRTKTISSEDDRQRNS